MRDPARDGATPPVRVLLLEHEQTDVELTLWALARQGVTVGALVTAASRDDFERSLDSFDPDVILSDYTVPSFSGEEALKLALARRPHVPFIFVSGMLGEDRAVELLKAGAWDYVLKDRLTRLGPAVTRALREASEAADRRRLETEREAALVELRASEERLRSALARLQGLQELTAALAGALTIWDVGVVLQQVVAPLLEATSGALALVDHGGDLSRAYSWTDPDHPGSTSDPVRCWRPPEEDLARCLRDGEVIWLTDDDAAPTGRPQRTPWANARASVLVPLGTSRPIGALALRWPEPRERSDEEQVFLRTVAAQSTQAIERARMFENQATVAQALQRALLPTDLPDLPGVRSAARYLTAHGDAVGGDWYDLISLPDGRLAMVMGDVEGHSTAAAAIMGQARNVLRAYSTEGHNPAEVMRRLNQFVCTHTDRLITCCFAEIDPAERIVTAVSAGHPLPAVVDPAGHAEQLPVEVGPPLGVEALTHFAEHTSVLPPGGRLVMFTDGLVEGPLAVYEGMNAFLRRLSLPADVPPEDLADALVARPADAPPLPDDAALLILQVDPDAGVEPVPGRAASRTFHATAAAAPAARHFLVDVLGAWGLAHLQDVVGLAASELVTNAVLHTAGNAQVTVRCPDDGGLWIGVTDGSDRLPQLHHAAEEDISGRGLAIVDMISDDWGVDLHHDGGKTVWIRLALAEAG
ncbi:MAG TPA: SpoIIE family protein phosphatase [Kineosporiaceae bacterium]